MNRRVQGFSAPKRAILSAKVRSDNLVLVPASLLPFKAQWEQLAATLTPLTKAMTELSVQMPALVESVGSLNAKLDVVSDVLEPLVQAEHDIAHAEHEVTKIGNLFSRHKTTPATPES